MNNKFWLENLKRLLGRPRNIYKDSRKKKKEGVGWIHLAQDMDQL
jgi:hypothetical protein